MCGVSNSLTSNGVFTLMAEDDSSNTFFVPVPYRFTSDGVSSSPYSDPENQWRVALDTANTGIERVCLLSSTYPVIRYGLLPSALPVGSSVSVGIGPASSLIGNNVLKILYSQSEILESAVASPFESSLKIHHWSPQESHWVTMNTTLDTLTNSATCLINEPGVYGFFATDLFVCGDADGTSIVTISDAVYLINYIFAGGSAPSPVLSGDADCNGIVTISDAVYLINYIFAGGAAPCAACL